MTVSIGDTKVAALNHSLLPHVFQWLALCFAVLFALTACAPAVLTSNIVGGNSRKSYFDAVAYGASAEESTRISQSLRRFIIERGDNRPERLKQLVAEAGGQCRETAVGTSCAINREYTSAGCFRGGCQTAIRRWDLFISWGRTSSETVDPIVRMVVGPTTVVETRRY